MSLRQEGNHSYGDSQEDIRTELLDYSKCTGYPTSHFANAKCKCGNHVFRLFIDDTEGAAIRECIMCPFSHAIGDSENYLADASLEQCECPCGSDSFEITVGVALYAESEDVRWFYIGCRCSACDLIACYGDWMNEFAGYQKLLSQA